MSWTHAIIATSIIMATVVPVALVPGFSVYGTHLLWLYSVSGTVTAVSIAAFWLLGIAPPTKKHTPAYKVLTYLRLLCVLIYIKTTKENKTKQIRF